MNNRDVWGIEGDDMCLIDMCLSWKNAMHVHNPEQSDSTNMTQFLGEKKGISLLQQLFSYTFTLKSII